jgi:hypothetical protein
LPQEKHGAGFNSPAPQTFLNQTYCFFFFAFFLGFLHPHPQDMFTSSLSACIAIVYIIAQKT